MSEPVKIGGAVSTWKLVIETRPGRKDLPAQRINLDIMDSNAVVSTLHSALTGFGLSPMSSTWAMSSMSSRIKHESGRADRQHQRRAGSARRPLAEADHEPA